MVKCSFTGKEMYAHEGIHLIKNDGTVEYYSSSKAIKNALKLRRDKRKLKWTEAYRITRAKAVVKENAQIAKVAAEKKAAAEPAVEKVAKPKKTVAKKA
ncbi:MAG: hypothetical protein WCK90_01775 [archaeon]